MAFSQISGADGLLTRGAPLRYAGLTGGTSICASGVDFGIAKGLEYAFGVSAGTFFHSGGHSLNDAENSNLTIIWGGNPAITRSVDHVALKRAQRSGTKLICIDPVKSETAKFSDEWISLRPGSDGALALALTNEIIEQELYDKAFLTQHTDMCFLVDVESGDLLQEQAPELGYSGSVTSEDGARHKVTTVFNLVTEIASEYTAANTQKITGIDANVIKSLARQYAEAKPAAIRIGFGVDRWYNADLSARAIATLACLCGYIGVPGGGISLVSGGRSLPVKAANFFAANRKWPTFLSMMEADDAVQNGKPYPIKMECISLGNPFNQVKPNRNKVLSNYIENLDFITVIDHFMTDTAKYADLVLPACTIFERTDMVVGEFIQLQQRVVEPEGEARSDFEIFKALANAYGVGEHFDKTEEEYIDEMLTSDSPLLKDVNAERLIAEKVIYPWDSPEAYVGLKDRKFSTPSGRIEIYKAEFAEHGTELPIYREPIEASPDNPLFEKYPLVLLSSHSRYRIHSTFANLENVKRREPEPVVRISPADAQARAIKDNSVVELFNDRGHVKIKCCIDETIRDGCVLVREGHWIDQFIEGDPYSLTHDQYSPTTENYAHYDVLIEMKKIPGSE